MPEASGPELIKRAQAIRLPLATIATEAGLDKHTIGDLAKPREGVRVSTLRRARQVIEREERRLFDHLRMLVEDAR